MADRFVLLDVLALWTEEGGIERFASLSKTIVNTSAIRSIEPHPLDDDPRRESEGPCTGLWALSVKMSDGSSFFARAVNPCGDAFKGHASQDDVMRYALRYLNGDRRPR